MIELRTPLEETRSYREIVQGAKKEGREQGAMLMLQKMYEQGRISDVHYYEALSDLKSSGVYCHDRTKTRSCCLPRLSRG